jgi:hypothetical protein
LANRTGERRAELAAWSRVGAGFGHLPEVAAAAANGELSFDHLRRLVDCVRRHPALAERDEAMLLAQARTLDADAFRLVARHRVALADDTDEVPAEPEPPRQESLHATRMADGWYAVRGELSPENGTALVALLDDVVDHALRDQRNGDPSLERLPASALRALALADLVAQEQRRAPSEASVPDRDRVAVVLGPDDVSRPPLACCDSPMFRAVLGADGEILDIGRASRPWPPAIRRAVGLRDGGCAFPGCGRPPSWCDIHHCEPWESGGPTALDNAALLCRRHHAFIHANGRSVRIARARGRPEGPPTVRVPLHHRSLEGPTRSSGVRPSDRADGEAGDAGRSPAAPRGGGAQGCDGPGGRSSSKPTSSV